TTQASGRSCHFSWCTPMTAASATLGWAMISFSSSTEPIHSPPDYLDQLGAFEGRGHPQREAIEACPPGQVLVMDARRDATAATGGDILMTRLMVRGAAGIVTDGGLRDTPTIEKLDFPVYCGARSAP